MRYLVNALASNEVHVARYYMKRGAYVAAANRAQYAVRTTRGPAIEEALLIMVKAYDAHGHDRPARRRGARDEDQLPDSPWLKGDVEPVGSVVEALGTLASRTVPPAFGQTRGGRPPRIATIRGRAARPPLELDPFVADVVAQYRLEVGIGGEPIASARSVRKRTGHVFTMPWMRASGTNFTRAAASLPATRPMASMHLAPPVSVMPGRFTTRVRGPRRRGEVVRVQEGLDHLALGDRIRPPSCRPPGTRQRRRSAARG